MPRGQFFRRRPQAREGRAEETPLDQPPYRHARRVGQRMVVGNVRLLHGEAGEELLVPEGVERHGGHAHRRAVPGVPFVRRSRKAPRLDVLQDPAPAGGPHVGRLPRKPMGEPVRDRRKIPLPRLDDPPRDAKRHLGVVGDLAGEKVEPSAAGDFPVDADPFPDLRRLHELGRGAQRVPHGASQQGGPRASHDRGGSPGAQ